MVRLAIGVLVAAAGCDVVFPPGDHHPPSYTLQLETAFVGDEIKTVPAAISPDGATYLVEDPTMPDGFARVPVSVRGPGLWYAEIEADGASVLFTVPDVDYVRIWQIPVRDLLGRTSVLRRADAVVGNDEALIGIDADLSTAFFTGRLQTFVVGAWVVHDHSGNEIPPAGSSELLVAPFAYDTFASVSQTERWQITREDQATILRYDTNNTLIGALEVTPFDQVDGETTTLTGNITTVTADRTLSFVLDAETIGRLGAVRPVVTDPSRSWTVVASPGLSVGFSGPVLRLRILPPADPHAVTTMYGNPFDWPSTLRTATNAYRMVTPTGGPMPVPLYAGVASILAADGVPPAFTDPAIPVAITVAGASLVNDNVVVPIDRTRPVEISAVFDHEQPAVFIATLIELEPQGGGTYAKIIRAEIVARQPTWRVPAEIFDVGKTYFIRVLGTTAGFPGIDDGDLRVTPPLTVGYLDSGVFQVP